MAPKILRRMLAFVLNFRPAKTGRKLRTKESTAKTRIMNDENEDREIDNQNRNKGKNEN